MRPPSSMPNPGDPRKGLPREFWQPGADLKKLAELRERRSNKRPPNFLTIIAVFVAAMAIGSLWRWGCGG